MKNKPRNSTRLTQIKDSKKESFKNPWLKNKFRVNLCNLWLLFFLILFSCARKGIPPSPDRFAPRLKRLEIQDITHLICQFSEPLDSTSIEKENFSITSFKDTLGIRFIILGMDRQTITLLTQLQKKIDYLLKLKVVDTAGNIAVINKRFKGSTIPDTTPPRITSIYPSLGATKVLKGIIKISFSEPIDTLSPFCISFIKGELEREWSQNQTLLTLTPKDSLKGLGYFLLPPTLTDLSDNPLFLGAYTYFTPDSLLPPYSIYGKISYENNPISNAMVFFYEEDTLEAIAISDLAGGFSLKLKGGEYKVAGFADTLRDGWIDLKGEYLRFIPTQETLSINLEKIKRRLKTYDLFR